MKKNRIYLSMSYYNGDVFEPQMELTTLEDLLAKMIERGDKEVEHIIRRRIPIVKQQIENRKIWCALKKIRYSLN
jgi:hypothetical protein